MGAPPYEVLRTSTLAFEDLQRIRRLAHVHDRIANRGHFPETVQLLSRLYEQPGRSGFETWMALAGWIFEQNGAVHGLGLLRLAELLLRWLTAEQGVSEDEVRRCVASDYSSDGRRRLPGFLTDAGPSPRSRRRADRAARQRKHKQPGTESGHSKTTSDAILRGCTPFAASS